MPQAARAPCARPRPTTSCARSVHRSAIPTQWSPPAAGSKATTRESFAATGGPSASGSPTSDGWLFDFPFNAARDRLKRRCSSHSTSCTTSSTTSASTKQPATSRRTTSAAAAAAAIRSPARARSGRNNATFQPRPTARAQPSACSCGTGRLLVAGCRRRRHRRSRRRLRPRHHPARVPSRRQPAPEHGLHGQRGGGDRRGRRRLLRLQRQRQYDARRILRDRAGSAASTRRTYGDWRCLLGLFCEVHDNGEIWANVLWDVRERFRADLVGGSARRSTRVAPALCRRADAVAAGADDAGHARRDAARRQRPESRRRREPELLPPLGIVRAPGWAWARPTRPTTA